MAGWITMFCFSEAVSMYRVSEGLCREDWSPEEIEAIAADGSLRRCLDAVEEQLWFPKPLDLFRYLYDLDLPAELSRDICFRLENLHCARSKRLFMALQIDSGKELLRNLPRARQMNILGHMAFSKTWITPIADPADSPPYKSFPARQALGDDSPDIILGNYPIRLKRSIGPRGEKTTLIFPGKIYPFPKVKVLALDEQYKVMMEGDLPLEQGARFWRVRFTSPVARKYLLAVRPLGLSEKSL